MPKALKSCPKSIKLPNPVTLTTAFPFQITNYNQANGLGGLGTLTFEYPSGLLTLAFVIKFIYKSTLVKKGQKSWKNKKAVWSKKQLGQLALKKGWDWMGQVLKYWLWKLINCLLSSKGKFCIFTELPVTAVSNLGSVYISKFHNDIFLIC